MKNDVIFLLIILSSLNIKAQESEITTYYFIRHAEKVRTDSTNTNPNLAEKGLSRAKNWATVFKNVNLNLVYSTNYNRTLQTASPTAKSKNLEIQFYNPKDLFSEDFKLKTTGKTVLVVGHSDTTPLFVNKILGEEKYSAIDDSNNSSLYIVTILNTEISDILLKIEH
ncbi:MAG: phosphoglycerate mutase family protein [Lutibacter sp.]|uniref:histidine phosphatase family protein n=1 Tax=Lutibacter sp. TaxID=1925666 RepID=UPI00385B8B4D